MPDLLDIAAERLRQQFSEFPTRFGRFSAIFLPRNDLPIANEFVQRLLDPSRIIAAQMFIHGTTAIVQPPPSAAGIVPPDLGESCTKLVSMIADAGQSLLADRQHIGGPEERWLLRLFETGFLEGANENAQAVRFVCIGGIGFRVSFNGWKNWRRIVLEGKGMTADAETKKIVEELPEDNPPWWSMIEDVVSASVTAIDLLIAQRKTKIRAETKSEGAAESPHQPVAQRGPSVVLQGRNLPALVGGKPKQINSAQYDVIESLVNAWPNGLTKDSIERVRTDARGILRRLRKDADWNSVIHMASVTSGRYRLE